MSEEQSGKHRWLISYADYMTLLCAFFIMLYSIELLDKEQYEAVKDALDGIFTVPSVQVLPEPPSSENTLEDNAGLLPLYQEISEKLRLFTDGNQLEVEEDKDWVRIRLPGDMLFAPGEWEISDQKMDALVAIAETLKPLPNEINVEGHTDDVPLNNSLIVSNWDLSVLRAAAVVRALELLGVAPQRMAAMGYAYYSVLEPNVSAEARARNRRVDIMVRKENNDQGWSREEK